MDKNTESFTQIMRFAEGKLTFDEFELLTYTDSDIWYNIQSMITDEMKSDVSHPVWGDSSLRKILEPCGFSVRSTVEGFGLDSDLGKSRLHYIVSCLVKYHSPEVNIKSPKEISDSGLLEQIKLDYIAGIEVDGLIEEIIFNLPDDITKKERKTLAKNALKEAFHIKKKHPEWCQDPEWPMGKLSPMEFVSSEELGERVIFTFRDVDTGDVRVVEQLY